MTSLLISPPPHPTTVQTNFYYVVFYLAPSPPQKAFEISRESGEAEGREGGQFAAASFFDFFFLGTAPWGCYLLSPPPLHLLSLPPSPPSPQGTL